MFSESVDENYLSIGDVRQSPQVYVWYCFTRCDIIYYLILFIDSAGRVHSDCDDCGMMWDGDLEVHKIERQTRMNAGTYASRKQSRGTERNTYHKHNMLFPCCGSWHCCCCKHLIVAVHVFREVWAFFPYRDTDPCMSYVWPYDFHRFPKYDIRMQACTLHVPPPHGTALSTRK